MKNIFISFLFIFMTVLIFNNKAEANNMKGNFNFNTKSIIVQLHIIEVYILFSSAKNK